MKFIWPLLAKIGLICQQTHVSGAHPSSGVPERMTGGWWGGLAMNCKTRQTRRESCEFGASYIRSLRVYVSDEGHPCLLLDHDDVIKWKHFARNWPFVRGIHRSPVNSPHKGQWRGDLVFSLICALNKRLSTQSWGWWFETPSHSLWRHCNELPVRC